MPDTVVRGDGLALDQSMLTRYPSPLDPKYALDTLHESWSPLWLFPKVRTIAPNVTLSNSVAVRYTQNSAYRPENLSFANGSLAGSYAAEAAVGQVEQSSPAEPGEDFESAPSALQGPLL